MRFEKMAISLVLISLTIPALAQRVKRKGTTPININKKQPQQIIYTLEQLAGKWQEMKRTGKGNNPIEIEDTLFLNFLNRNEVLSQEGKNPTLSGTAQIDPGNVLLVAGDVYTILSLNKEQMVLREDNSTITHTFAKVESFWHESAGAAAIVQPLYDTPKAFILEEVMGQWSVYRRQAKPGEVNPPTTIIKYLKLLEKTDATHAKGEVTFYVSEKSQTLPCTATVNGTQMEITAEGNKWTVYVYKADGKELVFGDADVMLYYAKPM